MSINRLVTSAILLIAFFVAMLGGYIALTKVNAMRQLTTAGLRIDVMRAVGDVPKYLNPERSVIVTHLQSAAMGELHDIPTTAKLMSDTDAAVAAAEIAVASIQGRLDDSAQIEARMGDLRRLFKQYRQLFEERFRLPLEQRRDVVMAGSLLAQGAVDTVSQILGEQLRRLASSGGEAFRDVNLADRTWSLRDVAGSQGGLLVSFVGARKPVTVEQRTDYLIREGRVLQSWAVLTPLLDAESTPAAIKAALIEAKSGYDGVSELKKKAEGAFDTGDFPFDPPAWRVRTLPTWLKMLALRDAFYDMAALEISNSHSSAQLEAIVASLVLLASLVLAGGVLVVVRRRVTTPIAAMTGAMGQIAQGELDAAIPGAGRTDEIGEMAKAVVVFRDAGLAKIVRDREIEQERKLNDEQQRLTEAEAIDRERSLVADSIGTGLAKLAAQDLAYRMSDDLPEAYRALQEDFNTAMQQLDAALAGVAGNVHAMEAGSHQITTAADDLSHRTEQQAASLEETAAALQVITVTVEKTADGARNANKLVGAAKTDAEKGGQIVQAAIEAMGGIEKSSKQISQIIGVIDEIAFQTNLLALNAGVEAARAGDAGRGFAVVAQEVRALAQRSAEAAKEIKGLVSASTVQVDQGVALVADSGKALERIVVQIGEVSRVVAAIAAGATEQATGLKEVNEAVNQMDQVTQRNAAMVEETTAASHALLQEAGALLESVSSFHLSGGDQRESTKARASAPSASRKIIPAPQPQRAARAG